MIVTPFTYFISTSISFIEFITAFGLAFLIVPIIEITKLIEKRINKEN